MTNDQLEILVGRIDERTAVILNDVSGINININELFGKFNNLKSKFDTLQAEHNDRKSKGDCELIVNSAGNPVKIMAGTTRSALAIAGSAGGIVALILIVVILVILKSMGLEF